VAQGVPALLARACHALDQRDPEAEGLARARLGLADDVVAGEGHGQRQCLDREGVRDAHLRERPDDLRLHAEVGEGLGEFVPVGLDVEVLGGDVVEVVDRLGGGVERRGLVGLRGLVGFGAVVGQRGLIAHGLVGVPVSWRGPRVGGCIPPDGPHRKGGGSRS